MYYFSRIVFRQGCRNRALAGNDDVSLLQRLRRKNVLCNFSYKYILIHPGVEFQGVIGGAGVCRLYRCVPLCGNMISAFSFRQFCGRNQWWMDARTTHEEGMATASPAIPVPLHKSTGSQAGCFPRSARKPAGLSSMKNHPYWPYQFFFVYGQSRFGQAARHGHPGRI